MVNAKIIRLKSIKSNGRNKSHSPLEIELKLTMLVSQFRSDPTNKNLSNQVAHYSQNYRTLTGKPYVFPYQQQD